MQLPSFKIAEDTTQAAWIEEWNNLYKNMISFHNSYMADYCEFIIEKAKDAYYNSGEPIMEDGAYDRIENYLKELRPESKWLQKVGAKPKKKVEDLL